MKYIILLTLTFLWLPFEFIFVLFTKRGSILGSRLANKIYHL